VCTLPLLWSAGPVARRGRRPGSSSGDEQVLLCIPAAYVSSCADFRGAEAGFLCVGSRKTLLSDMLTELRGVAASLDDDAWKFEREPGALG
jgi:hypothetical protein